MKKIRKNVFETNSSSSHSLVIKKKSEYYKKNELKECFWIYNGEIVFHDFELEFDRSFEVLSSPDEKLRYLIASYANCPNKIKKIVNEIKNIWENCEYVDLPSSYGHIDHQSKGLLNNYLTKNNISFNEFIMNKKYVVIIDGDEYCVWDKFKESGLVNVDEIETEIRRR